MADLPLTKPNLHRHAQEPRDTDPATITDRRRPETKLPLLEGHILHDLGKGIHVDRSPQQPLPENHRKDDIHRGYKPPKGMQRQEHQIPHL